VWLYWNVSSWQLPCCQSLKSSQDAQYRKMHRTPFKMNNTAVYLCMNTLILAFISIAYSLLQYTPVLTVIQTHFLQVTRTYHDWRTAHSSYCLLHAQTQNSPSYRMSGSHTFPFCVKIWYPLFGSPIILYKMYVCDHVSNHHHQQQQQHQSNIHQLYQCFGDIQFCHIHIKTHFSICGTMVLMSDCISNIIQIVIHIMAQKEIGGGNGGRWHIHMHMNGPIHGDLICLHNDLFPSFQDPFMGLLHQWVLGLVKLHNTNKGA